MEGKDVERRAQRRGRNVVSSVNTAVARNVGGSGVSDSRAVSRRRIVQRNGETVEETVEETTTEVRRGGREEEEGS